ncbi:hypothetical protein N0V93_003768 [Gnomoniopsis smithogilvyi]|uniref:Extracellular serine-rich protein n=1 Tax=Gnomoniopsis smithogilvyi TaxID=1191159 RepID=A0A9W8YX95_9PEZI|nr:hypothetical protein N0V93_003768 [Gnomoniopsis smithogilvyi]
MVLPSIFVGIAALIVGMEAATTTLGTSTGSGGASVTAASTSSTAAATHSIAVGASGFVLEPHEVTNASVGISLSSVDVQTTSDNGPTFQVLVNDTNPIFFYCAAPGSCVDHQMIGVINPNATFTYDTQLAYAENATYQMTPGEAFPSETASSTSATSTPGASSSSSTSNGSRLGAGAIAGIAIGAAAVAVLAAALLYMCGRRGGKERAFHKHAHNGPMMHEVPYANGPIGPGPRSPGQETFTTAYSAAAPSTLHAGQYGGAAHGMMPSGYPASTGSPPPLSEYSQSLYNAHGPQQPLMGGVEGGDVRQNGIFATQHVPAHNQRQQSIANYAVELPTSLNPGNSPLPGYSQEQKTYSWAQDGEGTYRPSKPQ